MAEASTQSQSTSSLKSTSSSLASGANVSVFVRWRPLIKGEAGHEEIRRSAKPEGTMQRVTYSGQRCKAGTNIPAKTVETASESASSAPSSLQEKRLALLKKRLQKREKKANGFNGLLHGVFEAEQNNTAVFEASVQPCVDHVLEGGVGAVFSYGQTSSGKTHTILGYGEEHGLYYQAMEQMTKKLESLNNPNAYVSVSFMEMHKRSVYDLMDNRKEAAVRETGSGEVVFRARTQTEGNEGGGYSVKKIHCKTAADAFAAIQNGLQMRTTGDSNLHSQSSRSHAFLELELTTDRIEFYKNLYIQINDEFTALMGGAKAIRRFESTGRGFQTRQINQTLAENEPLISWMTEKQLNKRVRGKGLKGVANFYEWLLKQLNTHIEKVKEAEGMCFKGKLVFVDLAGSEHGADKRNNEQSAEEWQEAKQINISLAALNDVLKKKYSGEKTALKRIPYRASLLTLILRQYFSHKLCKTVMIGNLSSSLTHSVKSSKTLRYCCMVAKSRRTE
jgi:hypothetical protein